MKNGGVAALFALRLAMGDPSVIAYCCIIACDGHEPFMCGYSNGGLTL